jgi:hypothetical protein
MIEETVWWRIDGLSNISIIMRGSGWEQIVVLWLMVDVTVP